MEELDLSKELQEFYENNKDSKLIRNWKETLKTTKGFFGLPNFLKSNVEGDDIENKIGAIFTSVHIEEDFIFSLGKNNIFYYKKFLLFMEHPFNDNGSTLKLNYIKVNYSNIGNLNIEYKEIIDKEYPSYKINGFRGFLIVKEVQLFKEIHTLIEKPFKELKIIEEQRLNEQQRLKEEQRLKELQFSQTNVLSELDKDGNGEVDVIEGNDFNKLLKKHQKSIVEVDRNYVQQFVKVSSYLKTKKGNIQTIFNSIKDTPSQEVLNEYVEILKSEIHTYNLILFNSLNMIVSLVEDDMITFYEIHEMFDTINMFDSKHEKDISQKLTNIGDGLESLMYEIRDMGNQISNSIQELSYVTEESNQQLNEQLSEIDSTMKAGNLINAINTYQNYKNNKNTKSLRG
jgi:methyl-accepting chemotaxis protein